MRVTIRKIAEEAGVSPSTVSRVLSGSGAHLISQETRKRVLEAAERLEYSPNLAARSLVTGRTRMVALWMPFVRTSLHARVIQMVEESLRESGYRTLMQQVAHLPPGTRPELGDVDGIIAWECPVYLQSVSHYLQKRGTPFVGMGAFYWEGADRVGVDLYAGGQMATRHLLESGCRRVAYLANTNSCYGRDARRAGYNKVIQEAGLPPEYIEVPDQSRSASSHTIQEYVRTYGLPDGIFCHNDEMAIGTYHGLRKLGVRVPDDVALIGCDGIEDTEYLEVPLSTLRQPLEEMCQQAWQMLRHRMNHPDAEVQSALLQPQLVVRTSSLRQHKGGERGTEN